MSRAEASLCGISTQQMGKIQPFMGPRMSAGEGNGTPLQHSCLEKSHGQRSLVSCSPWGREESDMTERLHFHFSLFCIGEGNGNPLQCSSLENPRDGVAQSRKRLKWLSSSSRMSATCHLFFLAVQTPVILDMGCAELLLHPQVSTVSYFAKLEPCCVYLTPHLEHSVLNHDLL